MSEDAKKAVDDVKTKGKDFIASARAGKLNEEQLKWGLSAGAIIAAVSLFLPYIGFEFLGNSVSYSGLDLLSFRGGVSLNGLMSLAIPISALFGLYLHFGEPKLGWLRLSEPGRPKLVYLWGMIVGALGAFGCVRFIFSQFRFGSLLGLIGLGILTFVYFKLWQSAPNAPATSKATTAPDGQS